MRIILQIFLISLFLSCSKDKNKEYFIYIVSRNTDTKEGDIVLKYNSFRNNISHIGIAFENKTNSFVYNVSYDQRNANNSSLIKETVKNFWNSKNKLDNKLWKIRLNKLEYKKVREYVINLEKEMIYFDLDSTTNKGLYCSEFVYNALNNCGSDRFRLKKNKAYLVGLSKLVAGTENLKYYPADFFLNYKVIEE